MDENSGWKHDARKAFRIRITSLERHVLRLLINLKKENSVGHLASAANHVKSHVSALGQFGPFFNSFFPLLNDGFAAEVSDVRDVLDDWRFKIGELSCRLAFLGGHRAEHRRVQTATSEIYGELREFCEELGGRLCKIHECLRKQSQLPAGDGAVVERSEYDVSDERPLRPGNGEGNARGGLADDIVLDK